MSIKKRATSGGKPPMTFAVYRAATDSPTEFRCDFLPPSAPFETPLVAAKVGFDRVID